MVWSAIGRVAASSTGSGETAGGGSTRRWRLWPAWMTQASPGSAGGGCAGWSRGGCPMRGVGDLIGVRAGLLPAAGRGEASGAVEAQLPVVLQGADHPGQGQQPLRVRARVDDHPTGAAGQQAGGRAAVG